MTRSVVLQMMLVPLTRLWPSDIVYYCITLRALSSLLFVCTAAAKMDSSYRKNIRADLADWAASHYIDDGSGEVTAIAHKYSTKKSLQALWRELHGGRWSGVSGSDTYEQIIEKLQQSQHVAIGRMS
jgi:hypothetical protein